MTASSEGVAVPAHPLGVKPSGNAYLARHNLRSALGTLEAVPDEVIIPVLELLDASDLKSIGSTCKAFYALSRLEDLWKVLCVQSTFPKAWYGTWRSTCLSLPPFHESHIDCHGLYSDVLHRPYFCAHIDLATYCSNIPSDNNILRFQDMSPEDFEESWTNRPFILTAPIKKWTVYHQWSTESLRAKHGTTSFRAEAVDWPFLTYMQYMRNNNDESPLYLFDRSFAEKMDLTVSTRNGDYHSPECFGEDLFSVLGSQRPDHRWLIVGPARSGSTFHKDPNATSAWNAVIRGAKYWIMFPSTPSSPPPPGVFVSQDQSEVTSPLSIPEWLLGFHAEARRTPGCLEGICGEGEVLHVPSKWWHLVINLEESLAITQNFVPEKHLGEVLKFLRDKADQVSGFGKDVSSPYDLFLQQMKAQHPRMLEGAIQELDKMPGGKRKWVELANGHPNDNPNFERRGFSFEFGDDGENEL